MTLNQIIKFLQKYSERYDRIEQDLNAIRYCINQHIPYRIETDRLIFTKDTTDYSFIFGGLMNSISRM